MTRKEMPASTLFGVAHYEYRMAIRRWGMWVAYAVGALPYIINALIEPAQEPTLPVWQFAGSVAITLNLWMPVLGGIVMADRLPRDRKLGVCELLASTPLRRRTYVLGKYVGVVLAALTPVLASSLLLAVIATLRGTSLEAAPERLATLAGALLAAFLAINVPAYLFVGAFSLACPAVLPVRVYQVLFTGYWFWGNFINPKALPTLNGTLLTPKGGFVASAFFHLGREMFVGAHTAVEAVLNLAVLGACAAAALLALERYLAYQQGRA